MSFDLEEALRLYPLPEGVSDEVLNRGQCAIALGVSENMISRYLEQGLPYLTKGSNGQAYEFQLSECYAWKKARDEEMRSKREAAERAAAQIAMEFRNVDEEDREQISGLTSKQVNEESLAIFNYDRAREQRLELVRTLKVEKLFEDILIEFRNQIITLVDFAEMEFGLAPEQVNKLQRRCDGTLVQARLQLEKLTGARGTEITRLHPPSDGAASG